MGSVAGAPRGKAPLNATIAALLAGVAVFLVIPRETPIQLVAAEPPKPEVASVPRRNLVGAAVVAGLAVWLVGGGGPVSAGLGMVAAFMTERGLTRVINAQRIDAVKLQRQAAEAAELMAACLAAGATLQRTTTEVARALEDPISALLQEAAALMTMGAAIEAAWQGLGEHNETSPIARAVIRSANSGAPSADALIQVAADLRNRRHSAAQMRVRSVAVAAVGPLGLCFLPAFFLLGVVPVVAVLIDTSPR